MQMILKPILFLSLAIAIAFAGCCNSGSPGSSYTITEYVTIELDGYKVSELKAELSLGAEYNYDLINLTDEETQRAVELLNDLEQKYVYDPRMTVFVDPPHIQLASIMALTIFIASFYMMTAAPCMAITSPLNGRMPWFVCLRTSSSATKKKARPRRRKRFSGR